MQLREVRRNHVVVRASFISGSKLCGLAWLSALAAATLLPACNDSSGAGEAGPRPVIANAAGPKDSVVACDPKVVGGACALALSVTFRLPEDQFVWKALVRFQGDGTDQGVDRAYMLDQTYGKGSTTDVSVAVNASVPPPLLRPGALLTYTVRLVTGAGEESAEARLTVSIQ